MKKLIRLIATFAILSGPMVAEAPVYQNNFIGYEISQSGCLDPYGICGATPPQSFANF